MKLQKIIAFLLCVVLLMVCTGCDYHIVINPNKSADTSISKIKVYDAYVDTAQIQGAFSTTTFCFHVPAVQINGQDCSGINHAIYDELYVIAESTANEIRQSGTPSAISGVNYTSFQKDALLSILAWTTNSHDGTPNYYVYNANPAEDRLLNSEEILKFFSYTEQQLFDELSTMISQYYHEKLDSQVAYDELLQQTLNELSSESVTPFIGPDGSLCVTYWAYWPVGGGYYHYAWNITENKALERLACKIPHNAAESTPVSQGQPASISKSDVVGHWTVDTDYTNKFNGASVVTMFGRPYTDSMSINQDGTFEYYITYSGGAGQYKIISNGISYTIDMDGQTESGVLQAQTINGQLYLVLDLSDYKVFWKQV